MGKKGGVNPTDQARKEARKKELKKNKKQRLQVRQAVIKQKDPKQIISELDQLDKLEFDTNNPPPYSVKVIQDKRKKLRDAWTKIYQYYQQQDPKIAHDLKQMENEYERQHQQAMQLYESVMQAQRVKLDDIPLPSEMMPPPPPSSYMPPYAFMPPMAIPPPLLISEPVITISAPPKSILKKDESSSTVRSQASTGKLGNKQPPGPPPSEPPDLSEFECDDDEIELGISLSEKYKGVDTSKKIRFNEESSGGVDSAALKANTIAPTSLPTSKPNSAQSTSKLVHHTNNPPSNVAPHMTYASLQAARQQQYQQMNAHMQHQHQSSFYNQQYGNMSGMPHHHNHQQASYHSNASAPQTTPIASSAQSSYSSSAHDKLTIEAKPVMRNKISEITKFVPTSLMVRRTGDASNPMHANKKTHSLINQDEQYHTQYAANSKAFEYKTCPEAAPVSQKLASTDAAYESFMKEIGKML